MPLTDDQIDEMFAADLGIEAVKVLRAENEELKAEVERLREQLRTVVIDWRKTLNQLKRIHADTEWATKLEIYSDA